MIFKSYLVEENINLLDKNLVLFYGENLGFKNQIKNVIKSKSNSEIINLFQDEVLKKPETLLNEILSAPRVSWVVDSSVSPSGIITLIFFEYFP